jgi:dipeptidyl aminopeptidase/acylaminoacyl peptidase
MSTARAFLIAAALLAVPALAGCGSDPPQQGHGDFHGAAVGGARVTVGNPPGNQPLGVVLLIHGGGWQRSDPDYAKQKAAGKSLNGQGYATVAIGYDEGAKGFQQILAVYKQARKQWPGVPICASGISAGGNLSLMLATREPDLACVLAVAPPTDLPALAQQDPVGDEAYKAAVTAFGSDQLAKFSPVRYAGKIDAKVLLIAADTDPVVPAAQSREMARALPGAQIVVVPPGSVPVEWAHFGGVPANAQDMVIQRELNFLRDATQGG